MVKDKIKTVGVVYGGYSSEREISIKSGKAVANALKASGYTVIEIDITSPHLDGSFNQIDVAFIALHGKFGEDGTIQQMLEEKGVAYTGSDTHASYVCLNKIVAKRLFTCFGVRTPAYKTLHISTNEQIAKMYARQLGYPVVVKPEAEGSSIGVSVCEDENSLIDAIEDAFELSDIILIEKYIKGDEITVGILNNKALPLVMIKPSRRFFDYVAKYNDLTTEYIVNPELARGEVFKIKKMAKKAYRVAGCRGFARVDMIYGEDKKPYVLEINTIPGLTERSLFPKAALAAGIDFPTLCAKLIHLSLL